MGGSVDTQLVIEGLRRPLPELDPALLYDARGAGLFEQITGLPEYYPTRSEMKLLERYGACIMEEVTPRRLAELASGSGRKILHLLRHAQGLDIALLDIEPSWLHDSVGRLQTAFPGHRFHGIEGDFVHGVQLLGEGGGPRLLLLLAGTLGNLAPEEVGPFMERLASVMQPEDAFLVGVDLVKDHQVLWRAYNDAQGVTAAFNLNALAVVNARYQGTFRLDAWAHRAFYDPSNQWVEMRVVCQSAQEVHVAGQPFRFDRGDEIRTEISCKYTRQSLSKRAHPLRLTQWFTDDDQTFALALLRP
jgi:L-histidine N-alpha-methyltransferase